MDTKKQAEEKADAFAMEKINDGWSVSKFKPGLFFEIQGIRYHVVDGNIKTESLVECFPFREIKVDFIKSLLGKDKVTRGIVESLKKCTDCFVIGNGYEHCSEQYRESFIAAHESYLTMRDAGIDCSLYEKEAAYRGDNTWGFIVVVGQCVHKIDGFEKRLPKVQK